jgi:hypothetical protein
MRAGNGGDVQALQDLQSFKRPRIQGLQEGHHPLYLSPKSIPPLMSLINAELGLPGLSRNELMGHLALLTNPMHQGRSAVGVSSYYSSRRVTVS